MTQLHAGQAHLEEVGNGLEECDSFSTSQASLGKAASVQCTESNIKSPSRCADQLTCSTFHTCSICGIVRGFLIAPVHNCLTSVNHAMLLQWQAHLFTTWALWMIAVSTIISMLGRRLNCGMQSGGFIYCGQLTTLQAFPWMTWAVLTIIIFQVVLHPWSKYSWWLSKQKMIHGIYKASQQTDVWIN